MCSTSCSLRINRVCNRTNSIMWMWMLGNMTWKISPYRSFHIQITIHTYRHSSLHFLNRESYGFGISHRMMLCMIISVEGPKQLNFKFNTLSSFRSICTLLWYWSKGSGYSGYLYNGLFPPTSLFSVFLLAHGKTWTFSFGNNLN